MPEYLAPGVYVEEVSYRSKSIEGVSTSTCAMIGPTRKGPYHSTPELITSFGEYERMYGGFANLNFEGNSKFPNYMAHGARAFFENGGRRLYVSRTYVPKEEGGAAKPGIAQKSIANGVAMIKARYAGSGYNGNVQFYQKAYRVTGQKPLNIARQGSLLRIRSSLQEEMAKPAIIDATQDPPFTLNEGDKLKLKLKGEDKEVAFNIEKPARAVSQNPVDDENDLIIEANKKIKIKIGDQDKQEILLPQGNHSVADLLNFLNPKIKGGSIGIDEEKHIFVQSDLTGLNAAVSVWKTNILGFTNKVDANGVGNVSDPASISVDEIDSALIAADIAVRASLPNDTGKLRLSTVETGKDVTLEVVESDAKDSLRLPSGSVSGKDGVATSYYLKKGNTWVDKDDVKQVFDDDDKRVFELLTINMEAEDADNNTFIYEDLGFGESHPRYIGKVLAQKPSSKMEELQNPFYFTIDEEKTAFDLRDALFGGNPEYPIRLKGGTDGVVPTLDSTLKGAVAYSDALEQLKSIGDIAIVAAPGHTAIGETSFVAVQDALIGHAEDLKYRFIILDSRSKESLQEVRGTRSRIDSSYAALYYPWITVANPLWQPGDNREPREIDVPPSGFMAGVYARTDITRGVWKAPANEVLRGAIRFEQSINHSQQQVLNPEGINCLRFFFGRGNRAWGARTASSDPEWKYVNIRRYFIYLEDSIDRSTQWAVFEPNGSRLWSNITDTVSAFLYNEWRNGALLGSTPEEAFFVRCDRSTMTQADLDNGRLVCEVGVAAIKPAEFVIFRIGQKTVDAN